MRPLFCRTFVMVERQKVRQGLLKKPSLPGSKILKLRYNIPKGWNMIRQRPGVNKEAVQVRIAMALFVFALGCALMWWNQEKTVRKKQDLYDLRNTVFDTIEHHVTQKGGNNVMVQDVKEISYEPNHAVFSTRYTFDTPIPGGEVAKTNVETNVIIDKVNDAWTIMKLDGFKQHIQYLTGSVVRKPASR